MRVGRTVVVAVLLYVTLDLSLPMMPGAFVFEIGDSVLTHLTRDARPGSVEASPLGAFVAYIKDSASVAEVRVKCSTLTAAR